MFLFPLIATAISIIFAGLVFRQYFQKRRPYQLAWSIALLMFGMASLAETIAVVGDWNELLVKVWYLFGGMLVVGYLGIGGLYVADKKTADGLLITGVILTMCGPILPMIIFSKTAAPAEKIQTGLIFGIIAAVLIGLVLIWKRAALVWLATMIAASVASVIMLADAPVNAAEIAIKGWEAMDRSLMMKATVASINTLGSIILIGGALYSGWILWRKNIMRERAIGSTLIGAGALINAAGGFVHGFFEIAGPAVLSISLTLGVVIMFLGFLETGRQPSPATQSPTARARTTA